MLRFAKEATCPRVVGRYFDLAKEATAATATTRDACGVSQSGLSMTVNGAAAAAGTGTGRAQRESMEDGPEATANPTEKCNNNHRGMSPSSETAIPSDVMMMEATAKLNLMQRNLAQVAARAAAAAARPPPSGGCIKSNQSQRSMWT